MGKAKRAGQQGISVHSNPQYPYVSKKIQPRKPLTRASHSATDLVMFEKLNGLNGGAGDGTSNSLSARLEKALASLLTPSRGSSPPLEAGAEPCLPLSSHPNASTSGSGVVATASTWGAAYALSQERELKRLGFVLTYGEYYFNWGFGLVSSMYATGRWLVPSPLNGIAGSLENRVTALGKPVLTAVQSRGERVLNVLDAKIDGVITTAASVVGAPAAFLSASGRSQKLAVAKKSYLSHIDDAVELIKEKGVGGSAVHAVGVLMASVGHAKNIPPLMEEEAKIVMLKVAAAWKVLSVLPVISSVVALTQPSVEYTWHQYLAAHDAVVATSSYSKAVDMTTDQLSRVQGTFMYKAVSFYADPCLEAVASTETYSALVDHLRPVNVVQTA